MNISNNVPEKSLEQDYLNEFSRYAKMGGWRYLKEGGQTWLSDYIYEIYGFKDKSAFKVEKGITYYKGQSRKQIEESFAKLLENGTPYDLVLAFQNVKGKNLWVRSKGFPIYENGEIIGAWGVMQDITDFFLMESEHPFIQAFTSELHIVAKGLTIIDLNDRWISVTGYSKEETLRHDWTEFVHPDDAAQVDALYKVLLSKGRVENAELRCIHKDGRTIYLSINARVAPDNETIFAIARDVTDLKHRELEMQESLVKIKAANQSKNQFLMMMSHELRTPLNPIVAFTDLLMHQIEDKDQLEMLNIVKDSANHLAHLMSEILDISSIETGRMTVQNEPVDLFDILRSTFDMMQPNAKDKGLRMQLDLGEPARSEPLRNCLGDRKKIRQILLNLINNAVKFTRDGNITVHLAEPLITNNIAAITISVEDTGIGIPVEEQERIFEVFHQVQMAENREFGGQGLGLALSRKLARLMNGDISVTSTPGKGSCFTLTLNLQLAD